MKTITFKPLLFVIILVLCSARQANASITVSPANMNGWSFFSVDGNGNSPGYAGAVGQMVTGPATPPLGIGSAELSTSVGGGDGSVGITTGNYNGLLLSSITALSYYAYDKVNNGQQFPYLAININLNNGSGNQDTIFFEPPYQTPGTGNPSLPNQGSTVMNQWQSWNALEGGWWDNNGVVNPGTGVGPFSAIIAAYPNATIANTPYPGINGVALQVGFGSAGETETGFVDDFTIGVSGVDTTYNFEPVPEPTTIIAGASLLLPFGASFLRGLRKRQAA